MKADDPVRMFDALDSGPTENSESAERCSCV